MPHRFAVLALAGAATLTLGLSAPALAADKPIIGSTECTALVDADATVKAAVGVLGNATAILDALPDDASADDLALANTGIATATAALADARLKAEAALCVDLPVGTPAPEPTPTTTPPATTTTPAPVETTSAAPTTTVVTQINGDVIVNPTADDGSVAETSGTQVTVVPEGSAQTGEA